MSAVRLRHPRLASGWIDAPHRRLQLGDFQLESGEVLRDAHVHYVVHGDPRNLASRGILVTTSIGGNHHRLDFLIGPGNALDTNDYCIVAVDALGNGLSSSPSNASASQRDAAFPRFTIRDMVASQRVVLDTLGAMHLRAVVGASMGGMQALQWGVSYPDRMAGLIAMTPMARTARWSQLVNEMSRRALFADEACRVPRDKESALRLWLPLTQLVMSATPGSIERRFAREDLIGWLHRRQAHMIQDDSFDPFDWCSQTWAYDTHDVGTTPGFAGNTAAALRSIRAATLVCAAELDLYNPAGHARSLCEQIPRSELLTLPGDEGHGSAAGASEAATAVLRRRVRQFLETLDR